MPTLVETIELNETERCCALLEAVLKGLGASNCQAVADRPDWEIWMAKPSRKEISFTALLEEVKSQFRSFADGLADATKAMIGIRQDMNQHVRAFDIKIERVVRELSGRMDSLDSKIEVVMKELREHHHV